MSGLTPSVEEEEKAFALAQRKANVYAKSDLVPKEYKENVGNVLIAQNMAARMGADVLQVMQNLYIVHGRPGWSAQFLIATFNACGRFSAVRYRFTGTQGKDDWGCIAYATELATGEVLEGTEVTLKMAKEEQWSTKNGSKWRTMPEQMLRYRAATFFIRTVAPEIGMGLTMTREELDDIATQPEPKKRIALDDLAARIEGKTVIEQLPEPKGLPERLADCTTVAEVDALEQELAATWDKSDMDGLAFECDARRELLK